MTEQGNSDPVGTTMRCSFCGVPIEEQPIEAEVLNPGSTLVVILHLCDECWQRFHQRREKQCKA